MASLIGGTTRFVTFLGIELHPPRHQLIEMLGDMLACSGDVSPAHVFDLVSLL
jgi:hypothetical protein